MEILTFLITVTIVAALFNRAHARSIQQQIETNPHVLEHRLAIRKLDDAREARESQHLLSGGGDK